MEVAILAQSPRKEAVMLQVLYMMVVVTSLFMVSVMSEASSPEEKPYKVEAVAIATSTSTPRSVYRVPLLVSDPEGEYGTTGTRVAMPEIVYVGGSSGAAIPKPSKPSVEVPSPKPPPPPAEKPIIARAPKTSKKQEPNGFHVTVTAYSSTVSQTDDTPFTTASGAEVSWGIVASNTLPFGTKVRFPELFGNQEFVVKDRMNARFGAGRMDIWMPTYRQALNFGAKTTRAEIVAHPRG